MATIILLWIWHSPESLTKVIVAKATKVSAKVPRAAAAKKEMNLKMTALSAGESS